MSTEKILLGKKGEELVALWLEQRNFFVQEKNYTIRGGEIDIIASQDNVLVFVEVKLRRNPAFYLSELITHSKRKKIISTALYYISTHTYAQADMIYRFDVALLEYINSDYQINYIDNAFTASENF
jgi:putative endonuclease